MLLSFFQNPESCRQYTPETWSRVFRLANASRLLARVDVVLKRHHLEDCVPEEARWQLESARVRSERMKRQLRWEMEILRRGMRNAVMADSEPIPVVLLKGGAYLCGNFPWSEGRISVDLDVLVPFEKLAETEAKLNQAGWFAEKKNDYDERYYREWMHEIPPMHNYERRTELDVHHTILPRIGKVSIDSSKLWQKVVPCGDDPDFLRLGDCDLLIHSIVHMFQDGDLRDCLRDLLDMDAMVRFFCQNKPEFTPQFLARVEELGVQRPVALAVRYLDRMLKTPIPDELRKSCRRWNQGPLCRGFMDWLVPRGVLTEMPGEERSSVHFARMCLLIRQHWLRMPKRILIPHLLRKWRERRREARERQAGTFEKR